ncbi:GNAT family N-acetyltransferase [Actinomycetes bacterium M1A6_2h]
MNANFAAYSVQQISDAADAHIAEVITLGDKNRMTLGFLPRAGYMESALRRHIVLALSPDGSVAGYCLYSPTRSYVRIVHVCVHQNHNGRGLAARMVNAVSDLYPDLPGLRLKCRRDWTANKMWPKLGFEPRTDVRGRSAKGHLLTVWWRANERQIDLFSVESRQTDVPLVGIDSNVFSDLHSKHSDRKGRFSGTVALLAGDHQIELALPSSVPIELNQTKNDDDRRSLLESTVSYRRLSATEEAVVSAQRALLASVDENSLSSDHSLINDARLIAEAGLGSADIFLTRDVNAIRHLGTPALDQLGISVIEPTELAAFLHRREFDNEYQPIRLQETGYEVVRGDHSAWSSDQVRAMLNAAGGERRSAFAGRLRAVANRSPSELKRSLLLTPCGDVIACWAASNEGDVLDVPLLRVAQSQVAPTVARQLLFLFRKDAAQRLASRVEVSDPYASPVIARSMEAEGFARKQGGGWLATALSIAGTWEEVRTAALQSHAIQVPELLALLPQQAAELERVWWPAKITDSEIPTYVVSVRSSFAYDLLGHVATLLERPASLGLARENVYYRSARTQQLAPGRILWYSSETEMSIVACSRLIEWGTGSPESLHRQFKRLGVWDLRAVRQAADAQNKVGYLRFADTEIFTNPIGLSDLRKLSDGHATLPSQQPVRISSKLFSLLYKKGCGLDHSR